MFHKRVNSPVIYSNSKFISMFNSIASKFIKQNLSTKKRNEVIKNKEIKS